MLYEPDPTNLELERMGLTREIYNSLPKEIIPATQEIIEAFELFSACGTQWRVGASGATGLDYLAVEQVGKLIDIDAKKHFDYIRIMEASALRTMHKAR